MEKTHYKKLRDPNYIGAFELLNADGTTKEMVVIIEGAKKEELKNAEKNQGMVLYLKGQKPMIVNSVNAKSITSATGSPFVEDWVGKAITLYAVKIKAFGETMDALRVKKEAPVIAKPEFLPTNKNWQKAIDSIKSGATTLDASLAVIRGNYSIDGETLKQFEDAVK